MWTIYEMVRPEDPDARDEAAKHADGMVSWADTDVAAGRRGTQRLPGLAAVEGHGAGRGATGHPRNDLMTGLVQAEVDGRELTDSEEIFEPILPVLTFRSTDQVIECVDGRPKPLALCVFSKNKRVARRLVEQIPAGGAVVDHELCTA